MLTLDLNKLGLDDPQNVCSSSSSSAASFSTRQQPSLSQNIGIIQAKSGDNVQL
jgi:hypothetical protein